MKPPVELSVVIPVYNSAKTIGGVVEQIFDLYSDLSLEVVLVNDGSVDESEKTCQAIQEKYPDKLTFVHLARNFGEHNAVLAGLNHANGEYIVILDDDGQNPPEEIRPMYDEIRAKSYDVIFGRYRIKHHGFLRNAGSWFNDKVANFLLKKPPELYLSSFKVMNRFTADEVTHYTGSFPYIDGLILRTTSNLGQIDVDHRERAEAHSNYDLHRLFLLWLNVFLNFSITPLRISALLGALTALASLFLMVAVVIDKLYINPDVAVGIPTVLITVLFFAGVQLVILGALGEYLGRIFLDQSKSPQFVVRYVRERESR